MLGTVAAMLHDRSFHAKTASIKRKIQYHALVGAEDPEGSSPVSDVITPSPWLTMVSPLRREAKGQPSYLGLALSEQYTGAGSCELG